MLVPFNSRRSIWRYFVVPLLLITTIFHLSEYLELPQFILAIGEALNGGQAPAPAPLAVFGPALGPEEPFSPAPAPMGAAGGATGSEHKMGSTPRWSEGLDVVVRWLGVGEVSTAMAWSLLVSYFMALMVSGTGVEDMQQCLLHTQPYPACTPAIG